MKKNEKSTSVFILHHVYEYTLEDGGYDEEVKLLGVFSTKGKGKKAIDFYKTLEGFKDHPEECFHLEAFELDKNSSWTGGFAASDEDE